VHELSRERQPQKHSEETGVDDLVELLELETCNGGKGCLHVDKIKERLKMEEPKKDHGL